MLPPIARFIALLVLLLAVQPVYAAPQIEAGTLDLRGWDSTVEPSLPLRGTAEFFWQQFIQTEGEEGKPAYLRMPGGWNVDGTYPAYGYGSYRIHVLLKQPTRLAFYFPPFWTAYRIYIDGELVKTSGVPGKTAATATGDLGDFLEYSFLPKSERFDIVFEISNYELFQGGVSEPIYLGLPKAIEKRTYRLLGWGSFLIGTLLIMTFYHFGLFFLRRSDRSTLYYGLTCLGVVLHMVVGDPSDTITLIYPLPFPTRVLIFNLGWILSMVAFTHYCALLFPKEYSLRLTRIFALVSVAYTIAIVLSNTAQIIQLAAVYQILTVLVSAYSIAAVAVAAFRGRESARIFFVSNIFLVACGVNDMFVSRGSVADVPMIGFGLFVFTFCQSYMLSARFSKAFRMAEFSEAQIRSKVEEQTREIKSIMQHIKLGIFTLTGEPSVIGKDYSKHLEELVQKKELSGAEALPLILKPSQLTQEAQHQVESALCASFGEQVINFELNEDVFPRQIIWQHPERGARIYDLTWNPITTREDKIEKILVTMGDVTELKNMEKQTRDLQSELKIVAEILNVKEEEFRRFVKISRSFLEQNRNLVVDADPNRRDAEALKVIFMNLHTLKGVARTLEFRQLSDMIHGMEQFYSKLAKTDGKEWQPDQIQKDMHDLAQHIAAYEDIAQNKLGRQLDETTRLILPAPEALASFIRLAAILNDVDPDHAREIEPLLEALQKNLFVPLRTTMQDIFRSTRALAKDLEKPEPEVFLDIPNLQIATGTDEALRHSFLHLLRNAMDHGIEKPNERLLAGKAAAGLIQLRMEPQGQMMRLILKDDGRGLNMARLWSLGRDRGLLQPGQEQAWDAIAQVIFASGVSTAATVTGISGRGIGMPAVTRFIEEVGGKVRIELLATAPDEHHLVPFQIVIDLPLALFIRGNELSGLEGAA